MFKHPSRYKTIGILAITQILSWGMLYYTFTILAPAILKDTGWHPEMIFGAFSWSLLVAGMIARPVGAFLDKRGGRLVMSSGSVVCALGLWMLSSSHAMWMYFLAWSVLGVSMALTLYEAAFTTIIQEFMADSRRAISTLTLFAGFASTIFWPLTLQLSQHWSWREILLFYAALQLFVCFPLHTQLSPRRQSKSLTAQTSESDTLKAKGKTDLSLKEALQHRAFWKLALAFAANSFIFSALSVHLISLLVRDGHSAVLAVTLAAWIGPVQVAGRIAEMTFARHLLPQSVGKFAFSALPLALLVLLFFGQQAWIVGLFCLLYGLSNGIMTIVRGTIPHALFGSENFGAISGAISGPALVAKAAGPLLLALLMEMNSTALPALTVLLLFSVISCLLYLAAIAASRR